MEKTFEALYAVAMAMADTVIINQSTEGRFDKLEEEYHELIEAFKGFQDANVELTRKHTQIKEVFIDVEQKEKMIGEISDVLFVLLHIGHQQGITAFELLHLACSKMLSRMNNPNYKEKN